MNNLTSDTVLQRAPDLTIHLESNNEVSIFLEGRRINGGSHGLAVLDTFSRPTTLAEGLSRLRRRAPGAVDWMYLVDTVTQLHKAGVLRDQSQSTPSLSTDGHGYDAAQIHVEMLNDRERTLSFIKGIREVVRPTDVVVDIGTGTGVLAMTAALAGARHVYAVEASGIGKAARTLFALNGLADRISLVEGWSTRVTLPERADVLVSEMIGHEALGERVLEITRDAVKRLLKPDARLIPSEVKVFGLPVTIPHSELKKRRFTPETLQDWHSWYGVNFSALEGVSRTSPLVFSVKPSRAREWETLGAPVLLADLKLKTATPLALENRVSFTANSSGRMDGLLVYFELVLGPDTYLSTHPMRAGDDCHWYNRVWSLAAPLSVQPTERFVVTYKYGLGAARDSVTVSRA